MTTNIVIGKVKFYDTKKAYGFIDTGNGDVFFHITGLVDRESLPSQGDTVEFEEFNDKKGRQAKKVKIIKS